MGSAPLSAYAEDRGRPAFAAEAAASADSAEEINDTMGVSPSSFISINASLFCGRVSKPSVSFYRHSKKSAGTSPG